MKNRKVISLISLITVLLLVMSFMLFACQEKKFKYVHDPRENPSAMADIIEDENAIYGFRPSKEGSLAMYADADWTDPEVVEQGRQERIAYHKSLESMYTMLDQMTAEGKDIETIARAISTKRNELRLAAYDNDPEGLAAVKERNLKKYGHEEGPLPEELYEQYDSWEMVISKAFSTNSGMDACLGLYDDYYNLYIASGQINKINWALIITLSVISGVALIGCAVAVCFMLRKRNPNDVKDEEKLA